jgi:hypothetical protein
LGETKSGIGWYEFGLFSVKPTSEIDVASEKLAAFKNCGFPSSVCGNAGNENA